ncbi:two-component system response regulator [Salirhabdus salicampi]|uniref:two-component system response regulator n=1 Tax=Salirhabdus salicampi TaxID=476102 RepID=UPI0020C4EC89|nr:EAL domain-containing protein [Salirhabdus salicampi]MCP8617887.1 EAL domain-containing protein [Salirhabdus salicampi]
MQRSDKINILMVDDRPENLLALEAVLSSPEYNLVRATSGEEALKFLLKDDYAVILLDVQMPGLNGFETAQVIKSRQKTQHIPIIFLTAINKEPEHVSKGYLIGAIDYLFKPFEPDNLKAKVDNFASIYEKNQRVKKQSDLLKRSLRDLEKANQELSRQAAELRKAEAISRIIGDASIDTMIVFNNQGEVLTVNPAVKGMFGYSQSELIGDNIVALIPLFGSDKLNVIFNDEDGKHEHIFERLIETQALQKDESLFPVEIQIGKAIVDGKRLFACTIRDITERKKQLAALKHQALHDSLTGLPNRTLLYDRIQESMGKSKASSTEMSLLLFDLDHFKAINDTLGHHCGDLLLKQIANRLETLVGEEDTVARLGGDEFGVLLSNMDTDKAVTLAKEIIEVIEQPIEINEQTLMVRPSVGVAIFPYHGDDVETLMRRADVAMYTAKRTGSGYAIYSTENDPNSLNRLQLISELRDSIDHDKLMVYYQPKLDVKSNRVFELEALVRWEHPIHGFIPPDEFIPLAEQNGLIKSLTLTVLNKSLGQLARWRKEGYNTGVAVNLSTRNLQDIYLPDQVKELLEKWEVPPQCLTLEITESFIMANPKRAMDILLKLRGLGIRLSIDDFGTGYSSLAYLKNLPVDEIKVDKSFVIDMTKDPNDAMIVRSVISLAHNLGISVVAEGVETEEIWDMLVSLYCDSVQGYYLSRPLPADNIFRFLMEREIRV